MTAPLTSRSPSASLDPCLRELRSSSGPFTGCTKGEHQINHRLPGLVPSAWAMEES
ncbi:hypothetical protein ACIQ1J_33365 [Streptomyces sp. NPDC097107]|uniref:hypothetical protein n=1 Tax=Streptomyces sp. NPDC097107 TaxID=3366089 RepID=UPI0038037E6B